VTEQEWDSCTEPKKMLGFLEGKASERKRRLFAVECCYRAVRGGRRTADDFLPTAEKWANGETDGVELKQALDASRVPVILSLSMTDGTATDVAEWAVEEAILFAYDAGLSPEVLQLRELVDCCLPNFDLPHCQAAAHEERKAQAASLRDLFGPLPFRPASFDPAWSTPAVLALARAAYEERSLPAGTLDPDRLAVLADALADAGCDQEELLGHLRGPGVHVRGCWVLDLVTGRE
jgi:hypothetical protein